MGKLVHKGRVFSSVWKDYDDFFDYGIGALAWSEDRDGLMLFFLAPSVNYGECKWEVAGVHMLHAKNNWANPAR